MAQDFDRGTHLHLIDGSAYIFRAYHALPPLTRPSDGMPVGAVSGFAAMISRYVEGASGGDAPTHAAVIFDHSSKTFRNDLYADYKANRTEPPEDLRPQFPLVREATRAFNLACIELEGYEADDIIATLARQVREAGGRVTIISSDKDLMQLVGGGVEMLDPMKNKRIGVEEVEEKFGVGPDRVVDMQALAGDAIDNVPGAPGIGIKTAALLLQEFGDLDSLLARAGEIPQPKRRQTLIDHADQIRLSRDLVRLKDDVPLPEVTPASLEVRDPDPAALLGFLAKMEFRTLTRRLAERLKVEAPAVNEAPAAATPDPVHDLPAIDGAATVLLADAAALADWLAGVADRGVLAIHAEADSIDEMRATLTGLALSRAPGQVAYLPLGHMAGGGDLFDADRPAEGQADRRAAMEALRPWLEDAAILKIGHDAKRLVKLFATEGIALAPIDDTLLMSFALNAGRHGHGLDSLSETYLSRPLPDWKALTGSGKAAVPVARLAPATAAPVAGELAETVLRVWMALKPDLTRDSVTTVYETLERPLVPVLAAAERAGIRIDPAVLTRMSGAFAQKMAALEDEIYTLAGAPFNVGSPKQLGEILFDTMKLPGGVRGKAGAWGTGADVLEDLAAEGHDLPARVLDWRQIAKLKATYTDALPTYVNPDTGRVHTTYSIAGANTGRLSSTEPNLQNIPIRTEEGRRIRQAFIAGPGMKLVSLDYSQIELRILAHVADIPALKQAFRDGTDIHAMTASQMFGVPVEGMPAEVRRRAKAINFGVIYGISGFGLARNLRIPRAEAQAFIDTYFERFPEIRCYMDDTVAFAREHGFVQTIFGRKMHTPGIRDRGPQAGNARRAAINAPIQGAAADIIRRAMIRMPAAIAHLPAQMLLQVHDELVFEVEEAAVPALIDTARAVMEGAAEPVVKLSVPLVVDAGVGDNWAEAH